jgi:hypothetical protein
LRSTGARTTLTRTLSDARERLCRLTDNRFDRRYHSLTYLQQLVTMGLSVGSLTVFGESLATAGPLGSVLVVAMPFAVFAVLTTLFSWIGDEE